jgi:hypothetical protein
MPRAAGAVLAELLENGLQFFQQVRFRAEMAEVVVAFFCLFGHHALHFDAVVAMEGVAFDEGCIDAFAAENAFESSLYRGGPGARGAGDRDDGVLDGHGVPPPSAGPEQAAVAEQRRAFLVRVRFLVVVLEQVYFLRRAEYQRCALVNVFWFDIQDGLVAR